MNPARIAGDRHRPVAVRVEALRVLLTAQGWLVAQVDYGKGGARVHAVNGEHMRTWAVRP